MPKTRAQLLTIRNQKILSGNSDTTGQNLREYEGEFIDSAVNIVDDMNVDGGYLGINSGRVNSAFINSASPGNYFLRDDGTWQPVGAGAITGTSGRITVTTGVVDISSVYSGQDSIDTVGTISTGTWSGRFAPREVGIATGTTIVIDPAITDVYHVDALASAAVFSFDNTPTPLAYSQVVLEITDNGISRAIVFDGATIRFISGIIAPADTIPSQTLYMTFIYNRHDSIWDCILCTNIANVGGVSWGAITGTLSAQTDLQTILNTKQDALVSGTNIKTVNGASILGSGNLVVPVVYSATPSISAGAGAGTGGTASIIGTNGVGIITINTGTLPATSAVIATVTFSGSFAFPTSCVGVISANDDATLIAGVAGIIRVSGTTTTFILNSASAAALTGSLTYKFNYIVEGY